MNDHNLNGIKVFINTRNESVEAPTLDIDTLFTLIEAGFMLEYGNIGLVTILAEAGLPRTLKGYKVLFPDI